MLKFGIDDLARSKNFYYHFKKVGVSVKHSTSSKSIKSGWSLINDSENFPISLKSLSKNINKSLREEIDFSKIKSLYDKKRAKRITNKMQIYIMKSNCDKKYIGNIKRIDYEKKQEKVNLYCNVNINFKFEKIFISMGYFGMNVGYLIDNIILIK